MHYYRFRGAPDQIGVEPRVTSTRLAPRIVGVSVPNALAPTNEAPPVLWRDRPSVYLRTGLRSHQSDRSWLGVIVLYAYGFWRHRSVPTRKKRKSNGSSSASCTSVPQRATTHMCAATHGMQPHKQVELHIECNPTHGRSNAPRWSHTLYKPTHCVTPTDCVKPTLVEDPQSVLNTHIM